MNRLAHNTGQYSSATRARTLRDETSATLDRARVLLLELAERRAIPRVARVTHELCMSGADDPTPCCSTTAAN